MASEKRLIKVVDATAVYNGIALYMAENAYLNDTALDVLKMVAGWLNEAPTVDAVEVVHGQWIHHEGYEECGECHAKAIFPHNYCPNCGAKMDGDGNGST